MLRSLASFCYSRRRSVLIVWVVVLVGVSVLASTAGGDLLKSFSLPGSESQAAFDVLKHDFGRKGDTGELVFKVTRRRRRALAGGAAVEIEPSSPSCASEPHVVSVTSPYDPAGARFVSSRTAKIAYAEILFDVQSNDVPVDLATHMRVVVSKANTPALQIELGGSMFTDQTQPASEAHRHRSPRSSSCCSPSARCSPWACRS